MADDKALLLTMPWMAKAVEEWRKAFDLRRAGVDTKQLNLRVRALVALSQEARPKRANPTVETVVTPEDVDIDGRRLLPGALDTYSFDAGDIN